MQPELFQSKEDNLLRRFEEIHDYIYANDGLSPQQTLEEFIKLLFIKILTENEKLEDFSISATEWNEINTGKDDKSLTGRILALFDRTKQKFPDIFNQEERIRLTPNSLGYVVNKLQTVSLMDSSQDAKGLAFQKFLTNHEKSSLGQFFTPTPVIDFCVDIIQPKAGEKIIDPACGSGGFIMSAYNYIRKNNPDLPSDAIVSKQLFGIDINQSIARIAKMKLLLEANSKTNILCTNSLEDFDGICLSLGNKDGFDIVLTNPPFGAKITNTAILSKFDLWL